MGCRRRHLALLHQRRARFRNDRPRFAPHAAEPGRHRDRQLLEEQLQRQLRRLLRRGARLEVRADRGADQGVDEQAHRKPARGAGSRGLLAHRRRRCGGFDLGRHAPQLRRPRRGDALLRNGAGRKALRRRRELHRLEPGQRGVRRSASRRGHSSRRPDRALQSRHPPRRRVRHRRLDERREHGGHGDAGKLHLHGLVSGRSVHSGPAQLSLRQDGLCERARHIFGEQRQLVPLDGRRILRSDQRIHHGDKRHASPALDARRAREARRHRPDLHERRSGGGGRRLRAEPLQCGTPTRWLPDRKQLRRILRRDEERRVLEQGDGRRTHPQVHDGPAGSGRSQAAGLLAV